MAVARVDRKRDVNYEPNKLLEAGCKRVPHCDPASAG